MTIGQVPLERAGVLVPSVFALHGMNENDLSAALAFALSRSSAFRGAVLRDVMGASVRRHDEGIVRIQTARQGEGITDIEVAVHGSAFVVFEAKVGAALPSRQQLAKYARRCREAEAPSALVCLTNLHDLIESVERETPPVRGVPVRIRSWRWALGMAKKVREKERTRAAKQYLDDLIVSLEEFLGMETRYSNYVYVVSLGSGKPEGWTLGWQDVVKKCNRYFYPFDAKGWPTPPNYMGFRFSGRLQCIRHVDDYQVVENLSEHFSGAGSAFDGRRHYLLNLGPEIVPEPEVRAGPRVRRNSRVWCMIDTLLTSKTISEALTKTEKREAKAERESIQ